MNKLRRKDLREITDQLETLQELLQELQEQEEEYRDNMPENLQGSEKYERADEACSNLSDAYDSLAEMYKDAQANDPNFLPSKELEKIVHRLDNRKIADMDLNALQDLYKAAVGLRTEFYNRNNVINDDMNRLFAEVYTDSKKELDFGAQTKAGEAARQGKKLDSLFNQEQLSPMNVMQRMAGWNPNSAWYSMAKQLEKGERDIRDYTVSATKQLREFLTEHEDWAKKADGQGDDGIWYEVKIPQLVGALEVGKPPKFGDTITVWMTPTQKVHMYLESKSTENLRHMEGGRTFADKTLYSQGKRREAFAQGKTVRMAPENVKAIVGSLTPEEQELAQALEQYYNVFAKKEINRVSNILYGYDKAVSKNYTPIYTNSNYTKSELGVYDATAEGVGNLKSRQFSKNPSYNIGAFDAFERHVEQTARFVGMAIPARNWQTLLNWRERENSMADIITHDWGDESLKYIQDLVQTLQGGAASTRDSVSMGTEKIFSNYIGAVFGANPSIIFKQLGSIPLAGAWLDFKNFPSPGQVKRIDRGLIEKYTQELDWRTLGYSTPETKQLKENPNWTQTNKFTNFVFGGGAITAMDGWAASVLWPWAENKVRAEFPELETGNQEQIDSGSSPFYQKVAEVFNEAVARSQSTSDEMHQGTLRKSKNPVTRAFTMFKSDSSQTYNALRQRAGEAEYYKRIGDTENYNKAKRGLGVAFLAAVGGYIWAQGIEFLMNLWKRKGKAYRDEDGNLTAESVAKEMALGLVGDLAGIVTYGEELADVIGNIITGDKWYGIDTPGLEQLSDVVETIVEQAQYEKNKRAKGGMIKLGHDFALHDFIEQKIGREHYSPAAVIMEIKLRGLKFDVDICEKTIYNYINSGDVFFSITNKDLPQRGGHKREYKKVREAKRQAPGEGIENRPPEIDERKEEGHWEMDTVKGKKNGRKCALMLSERAMRTELVLPMAACTMECVVEKLDQLERRWGNKFSRIFKTITVDNGSEFMDYEGMMTSKETGERRTQVIYCHPYRSNERGTNENQNRMFRRFFPKGTDLDAVPDEDISAVQDWMNNYPRKLLGGKTAGMLFDEFVASLS